MFGSKLLVVLACALVAGCATTPKPSSLRVDLAIANVTTIDPENGRVERERTVYVSGERIVAVEPAARRQRFVPARTIDGTGKYLIPGLIDMHVHLFLPEPAEPTLALLLANGVTGIREMSSDCWAAAGAKKGCVADYKAVQQQVRSGALAGPVLLGLTSTMVMGPTRLKLPPTAPAWITPTDAASAETLVDHLATRGIDLIKTHDSIPTPAFNELMKQANARGVPVAGHVPFGAGSLGAARAGYRSIEHARDLLYDCSDYGPEFRQREAAFAASVAGAERPSNIERLTQTVATFDARRCAALMTELARTGVYYVPTHVTREMEAMADEAAYRADPTRRFILAARNANWEKDLAETAALPPAERAALKAFFRHGLRVTAMAQAAGVPVMAGTDASDTMIIPGFSLHRELRLLREAGLSPMAVLRSATSVPARYFGRNDLGGIAPGMRADLVLLSADPLADISSTAAITAVVARGRLFDRAALDALLAKAAAR